MYIADLTALIDNHMPAGKYHYVTRSAAAAVCLKESGGEPIFSTASAHLLKDNLRAAMTTTGLPEAMILDAMKIRAGALADKTAKFRCEPAYWAWAKTQKLPSATERFQVSCSVGIGQQMLRWVLPPNQQGAWPSLIEQFMSDVDVQIVQLLGHLEALLKQSEGDLLHAYCAYNSGNPKSTDPAVLSRAQRVVSLRDEIERRA